MKILRRVVVKQMLTERSKEKLLQQFSHQKKRYKTEYEQLDFEKRKALKNQLPTKGSQMTIRYNEEIERRKAKVRDLAFQIEQLTSLPLGTEIVAEEIEMLTEIKVGDNWEELATPAEIIVKDGLITEIRE